MAEERSFGDASLQELLIVWAPLLLSFTLPLLSLLLAVVKPCFGCPLSRRVGGMRSAAGRLNALLRFRRRVEARVEEAKVEEARIETRAKHGLKQGNERQSSGESVALGIRSVHDSYRPRARSQSPNDSVAEDSERRSQRSRSFTHKAGVVPSLLPKLRELSQIKAGVPKFTTKKPSAETFQENGRERGSPAFVYASARPLSTIPQMPPPRSHIWLVESPQWLMETHRFAWRKALSSRLSFLSARLSPSPSPRPLSRGGSPETSTVGGRAKNVCLASV